MTALILRKLAVLTLLAATVSPSVAGSVYVQQAPSRNNSTVMQMNAASPAYVPQLPADAKPIVVTNRPSPRIKYTAAQLLIQPKRPESSDSVVLAIEPYKNNTQKRFPSVQTGATAVLAQIEQASRFPTVGQGLMNP